VNAVQAEFHNEEGMRHEATGISKNRTFKSFMNRLMRQ
jgi:hypothetical protein